MTDPAPTRRALLAVVAAATLAPLAATAAGEPVRLDPPPAGKALVVFYRRWLYPAGAISFVVREGAAELGRLSDGTYFTAIVDPGLHTYTVHAERHSDMQLVVDADETYYVRFEFDIGWLLYQPVLTPAQAWQFDELSAKLKRSEPLAPAGPAPAPSASRAPS